LIAKRIEFRLAVLAGIWIVMGAGPCLASSRSPELARKAYLHAVDLQQKLEARPAQARTAEQYKRVIREYRNVYFYDFAYVKAPVAAEAMGDLYAEMGRQFQDPDAFQAAIKSYQYVMSQYPGSSMAREAGVAIGKIYLESLDDPGQAADAYRSFLEKYPGSPQSREARKKLKEIAGLEAAKKEQETRAASSAVNASGASDTAAGDNSNPNSGGSGRKAVGGLVEVTDIHDWVGPNYTRVVIEARGEFQYNTLRLSHPDRIVFDLENTQVSRELAKKGIPINGAFLRDIRVGQFKPDVTRIVLDVKNINNYSAFPLPNPFRLIIDVHGSSTEMAKNPPERGKPASPAAVEHERTADASVRNNTPDAKQTLRSRTNPPVEASRRTEPVPPPNTSPAIVYQDQDAAKAAAEAASRRNAPEITKPEAASAHKALEAPKQKSEAPSDRHVQETAKAATEAASHHSVQPAAKSKAEAASSRHPQEAPKAKVEAASEHKAPGAAEKKTETASVHQVTSAPKRKVDVASNETVKEESPFSTKPASPTRDGSQTLTRALGLKVSRIVIDPGHGGFDTGTIGPTGLEEKDIVLDIGLRLRKLFETQTDSEVFMTRSTDKFIPLEERTAIANEDGADLFISIHANASHDAHVRGIETYFLNFTSDPEALRLAARENATSQESVHQLQNLIKKIALNNKIEESQELARNIQTVLYKRMSKASHGIHNRGVRKAPFVVLIGANMPSVLTEIAFLSNPRSERLLRDPDYREGIAKAIFNGIENYINNLGSVRVAQRMR
jgi:N-acetylmuramoyl-L-alanine amidase